MIIATHFDLIAAKEREKIKSKMEAKINELYSPNGRDLHTYPTISPKFHFLDVCNARQIDLLRDDIYFYVNGFQPSKLMGDTCHSHLAYS